MARGNGETALVWDETMKSLVRNPMTIWLARWFRAKLLEHRNREKRLQIGYFSDVRECEFGYRNTVYDYVSLNRCRLGDLTYVASRTRASRTRIGKFCSIGPDCRIGVGNHPSKQFASTHPVFFSTALQSQITFADRPYFDELGEIEIGNDVWIGLNAVVVDGVTIGDGAIIAAGSIVTKDVPPYGIVGGVPGKLIRYRFDQRIIDRLLDIRWWDFELELLREHFRALHDAETFVEKFGRPPSGSDSRRSSE